jgi:hypothetical protein
MEKWHEGESDNLESSPNIIRVITSRRDRWEEHVECTGTVHNTYNILLRTPEGRRRPDGIPRSK